MKKNQSAFKCASYSWVFCPKTLLLLALVTRHTDPGLNVSRVPQSPSSPIPLPPSPPPHQKRTREKEKEKSD